MKSGALPGNVCLKGAMQLIRLEYPENLNSRFNRVPEIEKSHFAYSTDNDDSFCIKNNNYSASHEDCFTNRRV
ncbi:MAG: hypothetical protein JKY95_08075 [Planctomycetaceae bacterium]|nr:hypothetical protein [Planctomycetaceae bacterium]